MYTFAENRINDDEDGDDGVAAGASNKEKVAKVLGDKDKDTIKDN